MHEELLGDIAVTSNEGKRIIYQAWDLSLENSGKRQFLSIRT